VYFVVLEISPDCDELSLSSVSFESVLSAKSSQTWVLLREGPIIIAPRLQRTLSGDTERERERAKGSEG
jgi:hypothetical protein